MDNKQETVPEVLSRIEWSVVEFLHVPHQALRHGDRRREFTHAKHIVWAIARHKLGYSVSRIARLYNKHHTTILQGVRSVERIADLYSMTMRHVHIQNPGMLKRGDKLGITSGEGEEK